MTKKNGIGLITRAVFSHEDLDLLRLGSFGSASGRVDEGSGIGDGY